MKVIEVENLGKKYLISHQSNIQSYETLRDTITRGVKGIVRKKSIIIPKWEDFWALRDITFSLNDGDRLGIIGRNGAGKTTLLKLLSRITEPSEGKIKIWGRVSSLLEVGTGFHPELTGRENIFLNGAILGMSKPEIRKKFNDIVEFAEIEKFLDTPVKRFSSGMYVRLAFAVAAFLEPEILIVDEVLAVGDIKFQKKSLLKMEKVSKEGRTILFVSHNMNAIERLCSSCMLLESGKMQILSNNVQTVIREYLEGVDNGAGSNLWVNPGDKYNSQWFKPIKFFIGDENGKVIQMPIGNNNDIFVYIEVEIKDIDPSLVIGFAMYDESNNLLFWSVHTDDNEEKWPLIKKGNVCLRCKIPKRFLNEATYRLDLIAGLHFRQWLAQPNVNSPSIYLTIQGDLSDSPYWIMKRPGIIAPLLKWENF